VTQNVGIAFKVGFSFKERLKPHMCNFGMTLNAGIANRVGLFQSDFTCGYCV
jgi:hypothetical protein